MTLREATVPVLGQCVRLPRFTNTNMMNQGYPIRIPIEEISDEDLSIALEILDQEAAIEQDPLPSLYWRRIWHNPKRTENIQPGDLHYYKNCRLLLTTKRSFWKNRLEAIYLFRSLVSQYICKRCAIMREKENKRISAYFLRLSANELLWTDREISEYEKQRIDEQLGGELGGDTPNNP